MASDENDVKEFSPALKCKNPECKKKDLKQNTILKHLCHWKAKRCKSYYSEQEIEKLREKSNKICTAKELARQRKYYDPKKRQTKHAKEYDSKKRGTKHLKEYDARKRKKKYEIEKKEIQNSAKVRIRNFRKECQFGPIFTCVSCRRDLFKRSVRILKKGDKLDSKLRKNGTYNNYLLDEKLSFEKGKKKIRRPKEIDDSLKVFGNFHLCWSCVRYLEKQEMPPICFKNCLDYPNIPDCLQLTNLEKQFIVKSLIFIKVRELPKTRMAVMNDRVINVPIEDNDIIKEVTSLPRTEKNSGMVTVKMKRKMSMKNYHKMGLIRPQKIYEALVFLKKNHPEYKDINITECDDWLKECQSENDLNSDEDDNDSIDSSHESDPEQLAESINDLGNNSEENKNDEPGENEFNSVTCLLPEDPLCDVIVNTSGEPLKKRPRRSSNFVHEFAPGERKKATNWIRDENHDTKGFPCLFHDGKCGLNDKNRKRKIPAKQNFCQKVLNKNKKFCMDQDYIFVAQQHLERHSFENQVSVSVQRGVKRKATDGSNCIKSNDVMDVFKTIPGTPAYWKSYRNEIFAMMEQLGAFHFFFTLSCAEMRWPEVKTSILHTIGKKISYESGWEEDESKIKIDDVPLPQFWEQLRDKSQHFKDQYLLITRIFDNKVKAFTKLLTANGVVSNYSYRIEFQLRGMPHAHGVFWLRKDIIDKVKVGDDYDDSKVTELIDEWITCSLDTGMPELNQLVSEVNVHRHTKSCQKGKSLCRFNFPRFPCKRTLIAGPVLENLSDEEKEQEVSNSKKILDLVKKKLIELSDKEIEDDFENDLDLFLTSLEIDYKDYEKALSISERGKIVIMKRTLRERYVNNYNKEWMLAWRGNLDIQFSYDGYAVVTYITDYLSKADAGTTKALRKALSETKGCNDFERLNYMKKVFFTHRQVSVAEAAYRLIPGMNLKYSNVQTKFVSSGYTENRSLMYKKVSDEKDFDSDSEDKSSQDEFRTTKEQIEIPGRKGKFEEAGITIHERYQNRPKTLENVCLAQFATSYEALTNKPKDVIFINGSSRIKGHIEYFGSTKKLPKYIELSCGGYMRLRNSPKILRIHSSSKKKGEEGIYAEVLLFYHWRDENVLRKSFVKVFDKNFDKIKENKQTIYPNSPMIDALRELINNPEESRPIHFNDLDTTGEQQNLDDLETLEPLDTTELPDDENDTRNVKTEGSIFKPIVVDEPEVMLKHARSLSFEQRIVFDKIVKFCKEVRRYKKGGNIRPNPPQLIVKGNGGTGKTYLIRTVCKWAEKILGGPGEIKPKVLRLSFAAVAASLIDGTTLHSGIGFNFGRDQHSLSKDKLDKMKKELEEVEIVIVDEMSMISVDHFYHLHKRLVEIFDCKDNFGGRALMLVGDILQLPPVQGLPIYCQPKSEKSRILMSMKDQQQQPIGDLWNSLQVVALKTNFRQGKDMSWTELLNRVRIGEPSSDDIELLRSRPHSILSKEEYELASHLCYTNRETMEHNTNMINSLDCDLKSNKAKIDVPCGSNYKPKVNDWGLIDKTNFSMNLELKVGARIMIVFNVDIPDNLVNGTFGTVIDIITSSTNEIETVVVAFDNPDTGVQQRIEFKHIADKYTDQSGCPIFKATTEYYIDFKGRGMRNQGKSHGAKCRLTQFPMRLAWASTGHKVQGVTIKKGTNVVIHGHKKMPYALMYMMLSRAESKQNVFLENFDPKQIKADTQALIEDAKLNARSIVSQFEDMHFNIFILNVRSLAKHFFDLNYDMFAQKSDHICVLETWIEPDTFNNEDFEMSDRIFEHASQGKGKGCAVFSDISSSNHSSEKVVNDNFQILSIMDGPIQLVLTYLSSDCNMEDVVQTFKDILLSDYVPIISGDFNFDSNEENALTRFFKNKNFTQLVDVPTHDMGRTIDHCYVPKVLSEKFQLTYHSPYYSDHDAICINFDL